MTNIFELEYRGLNLMEEISSVELAIDLHRKTIHIYDTNQVVWPEFNFTNGQYRMSDGFFKMQKVLYDKQFFSSSSPSADQWRNEWIWIFYGTKIIKYIGQKTIVISKTSFTIDEQSKEHDLYNKYLVRVM